MAILKSLAPFSYFHRLTISNSVAPGVNSRSRVLAICGIFQMIIRKDIPNLICKSIIDRMTNNTLSSVFIMIIFQFQTGCEIPRSTSSGINGNLSNHTPVASNTAAVTAGARHIFITSPNPRAPQGPRGSGISRTIMFNFSGISKTPGMRYVDRLGVRTRPSFSMKFSRTV